MKWLKTKTTTWRLLFAPALTMIIMGGHMYYAYQGTLGVILIAIFVPTGILLGLIAYFKGWF